MSKQLIFHYWCDNAKAAKHKPQTVEATPLTVWSRDKYQLVEVDLCEPCQTKIKDSEMQELASVFGRDIEPGEDPALLSCPLGCNGGKPFKTPAGRSLHLTRRSQTDEAHEIWVMEHSKNGD